MEKFVQILKYTSDRWTTHFSLEMPQGRFAQLLLESPKLGLKRAKGKEDMKRHVEENPA